MGEAKGDSGRRGTRGNEVLLAPFGICLMRAMIDGTERGRYFLMMSLVGLGRVAKKPVSIALQKVDFSRKPAVAWMNWAKAILVG